MSSAVIEEPQDNAYNPELPLTPEILVSRLGDYLVEKGEITEQQLIDALNAQQDMRARGQNALLGQILLRRGVIQREQLDAAVTALMINLRNALQDANSQLERRVQERTAELENALRRLSELNKLKNNFVANISHELRTPLTHLKGYLELLVTGDLGDVNEDQRHALKVMQRSATRLEHLIEDLILFSMTEKGQVSLEIRAFDLLHLVDILNDSAKTKAAEHNLQLQVIAPQQLPQTLGDEDKIAWVIMQLVDNAVKFTPAGGTITLRIEQQDTLAMVSVSDTGIGIAPERLAEIFEPFHQLDGSSTRRYGGTGLGLTLARNIIEAHGSNLTVRSQLNQGSQFEFALRILDYRS